jgi:hypothetical protein
LCWSFSLSSRTHRISHLPSDRLPRARCALLGFQTQEREKERRNKSSVAIINTNNNNKV